MKLNVNHFKNAKGSAIITVLIVISLLTILGTGLLIMSVTGLRQRLILSGANKAFYIADGAIEETLAEINDIVFEAEAFANNEVNDAFDFEEENIFQALKNGKLKDEFLSNETWIPFLEKLEADLQNEELNEEEAMEYIELGLRCEFLKKYYGQLLSVDESNLTYSLMDGDDYIGTIDDYDNFISSAINFPSISGSALKNSLFLELQSIEIATFVNGESGYSTKAEDSSQLNTAEVTSSFSLSEGLFISIKTDGSYNEHKRALEVGVTVTEPKYTYVFKTAQGNEEIRKNEIFDYAITSGKDIVVADGDVNVIGNVYAYGTFPETTDEILPSEMGGVSIGYERSNNDFLDGLSSKFAFDSLLGNKSAQDGSLSVIGSLYTRSNVKIHRIGNDLNVSQNLGANAFRTEQNADNNGDTSINIDGNMYLFEDLVFRGGGGNTNVRIGKEGTPEGDLYLIHNIEGARNEPKDISATIIIQQDLVDKVRVDLNQLYVGGVAFSGINRQVTDENGTYTQHFMTGESITVENKYMDFYRSSYAENEGYADQLAPHLDTTYYYEVEDSEGNVTVYEFKGFMELDPDFAKENEENGRSSNLNFKTEAFYGGATQGSYGASVGVEEGDKEIVTIRSINEDDDFVANYALGVIFGTMGDNSTGVVRPEAFMPISNFLDHQTKTILLNADPSIGRDVDRLMNLLATRDIKLDTNDVFEYVTPSESLQPDLIKTNKDVTRLDQMIDFSQDIEEIDFINNIRIVNPDANKDVYINPPGSIDSDDIAIGNGQTNTLTDLSGVIATRGDVYIYAPSGVTVDFSGLISAEGRIIFYGPGTKNIRLNTDLVHYQVAAYDNMGNAFYANTGRSIENIAGYYNENTDLTKLFDMSDFNSRSYTVDYGNPPVIAVLPTGEKINVRLDQPPILVGMQKNKGIRGYEIEYWRETRD